MKTTHSTTTTRTLRKSFVLGAGLLALGGALSLAQPTQAAPRRDNNGRNDVRREQRDVKQARRNLERQRQDVRQERRQNTRQNNRQNNRPGWGRPAFGQSYTGTVTAVRASNSFDVRLNGSTFNVYAASRLPRGLSVGDQVRVNGVRQDKNDIRQASVVVVRNR